VTFLFDENMPKVLAKVLRDLGKSVSHSRDITELGRGALDARVIEYAARNGQIIVSRDFAMADENWFTPAVKKEGAGVIFVRAGRAGKELKLWPLAQLVVKGWDNIESYSAKNSTPFVALMKRNGTVSTYH
jgi:predicted nuclease of predicted toxin-antitoxin system